MRFTYQHQGQTYTLDLTVQPDGRYTASIGERAVPLEARPLPNGGWHLRIDDKTYTVYSTARNDQRFVQVNAADYSLTIPSAKSTRRKTSSTGDELTAQMPGQVMAVLVAAGDTVIRGQTLLILEAMKMEIRVIAPEAGQIRQVFVQTGAVVERGQKLVLFETPQ
jgi:biotin carboxyl carrier protein